MKLFNPNSIRVLPVAIAAITAASAMAGNIPQYAFTKTNIEPEKFEFLQDGTVISGKYDEGDLIFANGVVANFNAKSSEGFPIGFDFRFGGKVFDQVAVSTSGKMLFGKDQVVYRGNINKFFGDNILSTENYHYLGFYAAKGSITVGKLSYKTVGAPGDRRFIIEYKDVLVKGTDGKEGGFYSMQIVLSEKDNSVKYNFLEQETPYGAGFGMAAGIAGWEHTDRYAIYGENMGAEFSRSPIEDINAITEPYSYIHWPNNDIYDEYAEEDEEDEDGRIRCNPYCFTLAFTPEPAVELSAPAPANLLVSQTGKDLNISCDRAEGTGATLILLSEKPFTAAEYPAEGVSYQVFSQDKKYVSKIGEATVIYYGNDEHPSTTYAGIADSTPYYILAVGANGYPSYSINAADVEFVTSHPAPRAVTASGADETHVTLNVTNDDDIMVAASTERVKTQSEGATGYFGTPDADMIAGDAIPGGGKVLYVGQPGEVTVEVAPNRQHFFRVWTLKDGRLSATATDARGVSAPSLPYIPELEYWTLYETPQGWTNRTTNTDTTVDATFYPTYRVDGTNDFALKGISVNGTESTLLSPALPLAKAEKIIFEWAMETVRDVAPSEPVAGPTVVLPEGNDPGVFGQGHKFVVTAGARGTEKTLWETDTYTGKMEASPSEPDKNISGTSEFIPVEINVKDLGLKDNNRIGFKFSTKGYSMLYLRGIRVYGDTTGVEGIEGTSVFGWAAGTYPVYNLQGIRVATVEVAEGEAPVLNLPAGIYICGGRKINVR